MAWVPTDLHGRVFGDLTVVAHLGPRVGSKERTHVWLCQCICGTKTEVRSSLLLQGRTKSCGCLRWRKATTHGETYGSTSTPEYTAWRSMKTRCSNPNDRSYHDYGGRGIRVCPRWENSFLAFLEDMGRRPSPKHSIDRIDNGQGYSPQNCRWATKTQQQSNRRVSRSVRINGRKYRSLSAAKRDTGLSMRRIRQISEEQNHAQQV